MLIGKSIAIMQPYIFPYLGYFQLVNAVDEFVFYDDVNFIKQGWVNRNQILVNQKSFMFSVPIKNISSFSKICDTEIDERAFDKWRAKFLRTLSQSYKKAEYFSVVFPLIEDVLSVEPFSISMLAEKSIISIASYLDIPTKFSRSSESFSESQYMDKAERLTYICKTMDATRYINAIGGQEIYSKSDFDKAEIELSFLRYNLPCYKQYADTFIPGLSMIDVLMFNDKARVQAMLSNYELV